jgi:hypothetical protein
VSCISEKYLTPNFAGPYIPVFGEFWFYIKMIFLQFFSTNEITDLSQNNTSLRSTMLSHQVIQAIRGLPQIDPRAFGSIF